MPVIVTHPNVIVAAIQPKTESLGKSPKKSQNYKMSMAEDRRIIAKLQRRITELNSL